MIPLDRDRDRYRDRDHEYITHNVIRGLGAQTYNTRMSQVYTSICTYIMHAQGTLERAHRRGPRLQVPHRTFLRTYNRLVKSMGISAGVGGVP